MEPVAWHEPDSYGNVTTYKEWALAHGWKPLYTAPVHASDISQERVDETAKSEHEFECPRCGHCCQQREWVGLTDEDIYKVIEENIPPQLNTLFDMAKWVGGVIEAKLKEKNT